MNNDDSYQQTHNLVQRDYYESRTQQQNWRMLPGSSRYIAAHVRRVLDSNLLHQGDKVLDVGCGMGKFTIPLRREGVDIEGFDLSPFLLEKLVSACPEGIDVATHCGDVLIPPASLHGQFDAITGFFMLHHLIDIKNAFVGMKQLLKPDGRILFVDVNPFCPFYYLQIFLSPTMRWKAEKGILNLTDAKLTAALTAAGFQDIAIYNYGILPPPLKNLRPGNWFEKQFDRIGFLKPVAAFKFISAKAA
ncbi:class I SAM-dependent methyltransferase [Porticoccus sp.]|uniref:class I SAM-dependent methyltransferase n=1 Tax=Porticoccus sp. TaxID=2024853 RepID=UPI003F69DE21